MKIGEYQRLAMRTSPDGHDRVENGCLGLMGESGEVVDVVKKWRFQSGEHAPVPREKLIDELGDVLWYCAEIATGVGADMGVLYDMFADDFFKPLHSMHAAATLTTMAVSLMYSCVQTHEFLFDNLAELDDGQRQIERSRVKADIVSIMVMVQEILEIHCGSTLEDAMEHNIEKLMRRYPDGFDPERSMNRSES